jgi:hypothetical protein
MEACCVQELVIGDWAGVLVARLLVCGLCAHKFLNNSFCMFKSSHCGHNLKLLWSVEPQPRHPKKLRGYGP